MRSRGQGLLEFALILPVLLFMIMGIIDFGRILFIYGMASNNLRTALRNAELVGSGGVGGGYQDCDQMELEIERVLLGGIDPDTDVFIKYVKATDLATEHDCEEFGWAAPNTLVVQNGDMVQIRLTTPVRIITPLVSGIVPVVTLSLGGQRTIVSEILLNPDYAHDRDRDWLDDCWEGYDAVLCPGGNWPSIWTQNATDNSDTADDPDTDDCTNGAEEAMRGSGPPWNFNPNVDDCWFAP